MHYILYSYNKVSLRQKYVIKKIMKRKHIYHDLLCLPKTNLHVPRPMKFKALFFKGRHYIECPPLHSQCSKVGPDYLIRQCSPRRNCVCGEVVVNRENI